MAAVLEIKNVDKLLKSLRKAKNNFGVGKPRDAVVFYSASYAIYVHENMEAKHGAAYNAATRRGARRDTKGKFTKGKHRKKALKRRGPRQQAKFLEQPAREFAPEVVQRIKNILARGGTMEKALLDGARLILRESQKIVPVEYGNLKSSGHAELE